MPEQWNYNTATDTASRPGDSGFLEVLAGAYEGDEYTGWRAVAVVDESADPPEVVELRFEQGLEPTDEVRRARGHEPIAPRAGPLTSGILRGLQLGELRRAINTHLAYRGTTGRLPDPRRQPAGSDRFYATWAAEYVRAAASSRSPVADLADKFREDRGRIRDWLHTARNRGLLSAGTKGLAGGKLTDKALAALGREEG